MKKLVTFVLIVLVAVLIIIVILRVMGVRSFSYAEAGASMHPTVSPGDICLCVFGREYSAEDLERGMVVLLKHGDYPYLITKRIIAVGGETVEIAGDQIVVDSVPLVEPYAHFIGGEGDNPSIDVNRIVVGWDNLFVVGDNRNVSLDSRHSEFGLVAVADIVGKPLMILWARDRGRIGRRIR